MATEQNGQAGTRIAGSAAALRFGRHFAARRNLRLSRTFAARRRRDLRFRVLLYDVPQIVNAGAVFFSALVILVLVFDPLFIAWQATLPKKVVAFFNIVTRLGQSDWILISTGAFVILMVILDAGALKTRLRARRAMRAFAAGYVFVSVASAGIVANVSKYIIGRARPKLFAENGTFSFDFWSGDATWASFPSGHATTAMALGLALALLFPRLRWVFFCLAFWIAMSRILIRAHYPSDVFTGCLLGATAAWLIARALARHRLIFGFDENGRLVRRKGVSGRLL